MCNLFFLALPFFVQLWSNLILCVAIIAKVIYCVNIFIIIFSFVDFSIIFKILPSTKIVIDRGDAIMVTCRYNGDCDASLYKEGYSQNPVKQLKRSKKKQSNNTKSTKEFVWKYPYFLLGYAGIYICELTDCTQSADGVKKSFEIEVKGKLLKFTYNWASAWTCTCVCNACVDTHVSLFLASDINLTI